MFISVTNSAEVHYCLFEPRKNITYKRNVFRFPTTIFIFSNFCLAKWSKITVLSKKTKNFTSQFRKPLPCFFSSGQLAVEVNKSVPGFPFKANGKSFIFVLKVRIFFFFFTLDDGVIVLFLQDRKNSDF